jgi:hypothetical protein
LNKKCDQQKLNITMECEKETAGGKNKGNQEIRVNWSQALALTFRWRYIIMQHVRHLISLLRRKYFAKKKIFRFC